MSEVRQESPQVRNADKLCDLLLEMAILVDSGTDLILPMEGDDFLLPFVMAEVRTLQIDISPPPFLTHYSR